MTRLSPSKIKSFQDCSWRYWTNYHLKLPDKGNAGSGRGNCCHPVLECLLRPDRKKYYNQIIAAQDVYCVPSIKRMVHILARKLNVFDEENLALINNFILVALDLDFYCEGSIATHSEIVMEEKNDDFWVYGIIDKVAEYLDRVKIVDYKTQKEFFSQEALEFSVQAMLYIMWAKKRYPGKKIEFEFHQLKEAYEGRGFKKEKRNPIQTVPEISDDVIEGLKEWLKDVSEYLSDFDEEKAKVNFAGKDFVKSRFMCGGVLGQRRKSDGNLMHICSSKYPSIFFELRNGEKLVKTAYTREELEKIQEEGWEIKQVSYAGCPYFKHLWKDDPVK